MGITKNSVYMFTKEEIHEMGDDSLYCTRYEYLKMVKWLNPYSEQFKDIVSQYNMMCEEILSREGICDD